MDNAQSLVARKLADLVELAEAGNDATVRRAMFAWSPGDLLRAARSARNKRPDGSAIIGQVDAAGPAGAWLMSLSRSGHCREAAAVRLAADESPLADRLLALLATDNVDAVRVRAWRAICERVSASQAASMLPILIALRRRRRGAVALQRYVAIVADELGAEPWRYAWLSDDRGARRWAISRWLAQAPDLGEVVERLETETDSFVAAPYVHYLRQESRVGDGELLLASTRAQVRAAGLWLIGSPPAELLEFLLLDRSPLVREAARTRADLQGIDLVAWHQERWESEATARTLRAAVEAQVPFSFEELADLVARREEGISNVAVGALAQAGEQGRCQLVKLLADERFGTAASVALRKAPGWDYDAVAKCWERLAPPGRSRILGSLGRRHDRDRVRSELLGESLAVPAGEEPSGSAPGQWSVVDAAVLLSLADTGRLLRPSAGVFRVIRSVSFALGQPMDGDDLEPVLWRLSAAGLVVPPRGEDHALTASGRALVHGLRNHSPGALGEVLDRLSERSQPAK